MQLCNRNVTAVILKLVKPSKACHIIIAELLLITLQVDSIDSRSVLHLKSWLLLIIYLWDIKKPRLSWASLVYTVQYFSWQVPCFSIYGIHSGFSLYTLGLFWEVESPQAEGKMDHHHSPGLATVLVNTIGGYRTQHCSSRESVEEIYNTRNSDFNAAAVSSWFIIINSHLMIVVC